MAVIKIIDTTTERVLFPNDIVQIIFLKDPRSPSKYEIYTSNSSGVAFSLPTDLISFDELVAWAKGELTTDIVIDCTSLPCKRV